MESLVDAIVWYAAFVFSTTLHEAAHATAAQLGGDPTAYEGGQVSIDPLPHIRREPFGMLVLPVLSLVMMGWPLGFASAPYDPAWAHRYPKRAAWMSLAGPAANLLLLLLCAGVIWLGIGLGELASPDRAFHTHVVAATREGLWESVALIVSILFTLNLILLVFNLIPFPPLDGSGAIGLLVSDEQARRLQALASNPMIGIVGLMIAWYAFGSVFGPVFLLALNLLYPGADYR